MPERVSREYYDRLGIGTHDAGLFPIENRKHATTMDAMIYCQWQVSVKAYAPSKKVSLLEQSN